MESMRALALALALGLVAGSASAVCPDAEFRYAPAYVGTFKTYGFTTSFLDAIDLKKAVAGKTAKVCATCQAPSRGIQLASKRAFGGGYLQYPVPVGETFCASALVDLSRTRGPGAFAHIEFDSPAMPIAQVPLTYVFVAVQDIGGVRTVWAEVSGVPVGTPLELAEGTEQVTLELEYAGGTIDVRARPEGAEASTPIVEGQAFPFAATGKLGAGAFDLAQGDRAGISLAVSGEVFSPASQDRLAEIQAIRQLGAGASQDLKDTLAADARAKVEEAIGRIDPPLLANLGAVVPPTKAEAFALAQLGKAVVKLTQARDAIDAATPEGLESADLLIGKALLALHRTHRALATGSVAEAKIPPPS